MRDEFVNDEGLVGELLEGDRIDELPPLAARRVRRGLGKVLMIIGGAIASFVVLYVTDLVISAGDVPRGVTVAGIDVGGLTHSNAEAKLREELEPRLVQPVVIRAGDLETRLTPAGYPY